jgi:hypothetical protein
MGVESERCASQKGRVNEGTSGTHCELTGGSKMRVWSSGVKQINKRGSQDTAN